MKKTKEAKLIKSIVLNGKIENCLTGDEQYQAVGIKSVFKKKRFDGSTVEVEHQFPFTLKMEQEMNWSFKRADLRFLISGKEIKNPQKALTEHILNLSGAPKVYRGHAYSELTGYLWTNEDFKVGGHDFLKILGSNYGKYIHLEIDLYE